MKTKKMSLANIQGKLSRTEMKKVMAGGDPVHGSLGGKCGDPCGGFSSCTDRHCLHCISKEGGPYVCMAAIS